VKKENPMTSKEKDAEKATKSNNAPHFVVGLDVYEDSDAPLDQAFSLALMVPGTKIDVVWAPPVMAMPLDGSVTPVVDAQSLLKKRVQKAVEAFGPELLVEASTEVNLQVVEGRPAQAISRAAFLAEADMIIVGAQDKGILEKMLVGSVSRKIVQMAPCPVLVSRPRLTDAVPEIEAPAPAERARRRIGLPHRYHEAPRNVQARENMPLLFPMDR
jgi:nucleotide-binding universal stress UspA family protein